MAQGFANEGQLFRLRKQFGNQQPSSEFALGLYSNTRDTLTPRSVLADITPITGVGYAPITLLAANWTYVTLAGVNPASDVVKAQYPATIFTATAPWGVVRGVYMFHAASSTLLAWKDNAADYGMPQGAKYWVDLSDGLFQP